MAQWVKNPPAYAGDKKSQVQSLGREDPLEEEMATYTSILAWKIPWTEEPIFTVCVWVSVCMKEDIHHCNALPLNTLVYILYGEGHGNPLQYSGLENRTDRGACWATVHGDKESQTWLKQLSMHIYLVRGVLLCQHTKIITKKLIISSSY